MHFFVPTSMRSVQVSQQCVAATLVNLWLICPLGPVPALPGTPTLGDGTLKLALEALEARDYPHSLTLINEALEQGISFNEGKAQALNIRGSFKYVLLYL